jgi:hypothetical protein
VEERVEGNQKTKYLYEEGIKIREEDYKKDSDGEFEKTSYKLIGEDKTTEVSLVTDKVEITYNDLYIGEVVIEKRRDVHDAYGNLIEIWDDVSNKLIERRFYRFVIENN